MSCSRSRTHEDDTRKADGMEAYGTEQLERMRNEVISHACPVIFENEQSVGADIY